MPEKDRFFWLFFRLSGRAGRAAYFLGWLFVGVLPAFFLYQVIRYPEGSEASQVWSFGFLLTFAVSVWSNVALAVKRLHDIDRPGLFSLVLFVPVISLAALAALCLLPGTPGPNRYGRAADVPPQGG